MAVTDPGPEEDFEVFEIDEDAQSTIPRRLPRVILSNQQRFPVRARPGTYQVRGFDRDYQLAWRPLPTGRLQPAGPTVFAIGATGGFQLEAEEPLIRGSSYVLLVPACCTLTPPDTLIIEVIRSSRLSDPRQDWLGYLMFVPQRTDEDVEDWCVDVLDRPLEDPPPSLEVVFPPATETAGGRLRVEEQQAIILFLGEGWTNPVFEILDQQTRENPYWPLGQQVLFCGLGPLNAGAYTVFVKEESGGEVEKLEFKVCPGALPAVAGVVLTTELAGGGPVQRTDLLDERAAQHWAALLTGREELRSVHLPDGWPVTLRWQGRDGTTYGPERLDQAGVLTALSACLQGRARFARLDAGSFGMVEWRASAPPTACPVALTPALEARLRWLMLARQGAPANSAALGMALPRTTAGRLTGPARPLVEDFFTVAAWPVTLLPQARSVARELTRLLQDTP